MGRPGSYTRAALGLLIRGNLGRRACRQETVSTPEAPTASLWTIGGILTAAQLFLLSLGRRLLDRRDQGRVQLCRPLLIDGLRRLAKSGPLLSGELDDLRA